jgi:hypothetical protein
MHLDRCIRYAGESFLDERLHTDAGELALPAVVGGAVVFKAECNAHRGSSEVGAFAARGRSNSEA